MKHRVLLALLMFCLTNAHATPFKITSLSTSNGSLSWTNTVQSNAFYRVEWASSLDGPWKTSFQNQGGFSFNQCQAGTNTSFEVDIPMFYRVQMLTTTNLIPPNMVHIPGGTFTMGDGPSYGEPGFNAYATTFQTTVDPFWMGRTEVSCEEFEELKQWAVPTKGYQFDYTAERGSSDPVLCNWYDAIKWCNAKSEYEGRDPVYFTGNVFSPDVYRTGQWDVGQFYIDWDGNGYRLPAEVEWEFAAKGGLTSKRFPWGDTISWNQANYNSATSNGSLAFDLSGGMGMHPQVLPGDVYMPVCYFQPNGYGLHNMAGNQNEWCYDYGDSTATETNWPSYTGAKRVVRGGSCYSDAAECTVYWRDFTSPTNEWAGFRYVISNIE